MAAAAPRKASIGGDGGADFRPTDRLVQPLLTDMYQITMAYAYWRGGKKDDHAVFDLFFRKNPFHGEFTIFCGLEECLRFVSTYKFQRADIEYLRQELPNADPAFWDYLLNLDTTGVSIYAVKEGSVVFPKVPLMRVEGPLPVVQLLETTFLNLVNFASLVATNAARFRIAAGPKARLLEFGLRRAQGPDGGLTASRYTYIGGFDASSNVLAGSMFGIPIAGTHAHAFVCSFESFDDLRGNNELEHSDKTYSVNFVDKVNEARALVEEKSVGPVRINEGELAAFTAYALAFPSKFLALVDTYDVFGSGAVNYTVVAIALHGLGYRALGVRLDSGDLAYQSKRCRKYFHWAAKTFEMSFLAKSTIVASNDIDEETLLSLNTQGHCIDAFGVGTHLVTCKSQPALGCVYKLVEVNGSPRIKLSAEVVKITMPGRKNGFRLHGTEGPICDLLVKDGEAAPVAGKRFLCRHPFHESKRAMVKPTKVESLYTLYWKGGKLQEELPSLEDLKRFTSDAIQALREDHARALNPTPYKVSVSDGLYQFIHRIWLENAPIGELE